MLEGVDEVIEGASSVFTVQPPRLSCCCLCLPLGVKQWGQCERLVILAPVVLAKCQLK